MHKTSHRYWVNLNSISLPVASLIDSDYVGEVPLAF
jgi:hypothetical protein